MLNAIVKPYVRRLLRRHLGGILDADSLATLSVSVRERIVTMRDVRLNPDLFLASSLVLVASSIAFLQLQRKKRGREEVRALHIVGMTLRLRDRSPTATTTVQDHQPAPSLTSSSSINNIVAELERMASFEVSDVTLTLVVGEGDEWCLKTRTLRTTRENAKLMVRCEGVSLTLAGMPEALVEGACFTFDPSVSHDDGGGARSIVFDGDETTTLTALDPVRIVDALRLLLRLGMKNARFITPPTLSSSSSRNAANNANNVLVASVSATTSPPTSTSLSVTIPKLCVKTAKRALQLQARDVHLVSSASAVALRTGPDSSVRFTDATSSSNLLSFANDLRGRISLPRKGQLEILSLTIESSGSASIVILPHAMRQVRTIFHELAATTTTSSSASVGASGLVLPDLVLDWKHLASDVRVEAREIDLPTRSLVDLVAKGSAITMSVTKNKSDGGMTGEWSLSAEVRGGEMEVLDRFARDPDDLFAPPPRVIARVLSSFSLATKRRTEAKTLLIEMYAEEAHYRHHHTNFMEWLDYWNYFSPPREGSPILRPQIILSVSRFMLEIPPTRAPHLCLPLHSGARFLARGALHRATLISPLSGHVETMRLHDVRYIEDEREFPILRAEANPPQLRIEWIARVSSGEFDDPSAFSFGYRHRVRTAPRPRTSSSFHFEVHFPTPTEITLNRQLCRIIAVALSDSFADWRRPRRLPPPLVVASRTTEKESGGGGGDKPNSHAPPSFLAMDPDDASVARLRVSLECREASNLAVVLNDDEEDSGSTSGQERWESDGGTTRELFHANHNLAETNVRRTATFTSFREIRIVRRDNLLYACVRGEKDAGIQISTGSGAAVGVELARIRGKPGLTLRRGLFESDIETRAEFGALETTDRELGALGIAWLARAAAFVTGVDAERAALDVRFPPNSAAHRDHHHSQVISHSTRRRRVVVLTSSASIETEYRVRAQVEAVELEVVALPGKESSFGARAALVSLSHARRELLPDRLATQRSPPFELRVDGHVIGGLSSQTALTTTRPLRVEASLASLRALGSSFETLSARLNQFRILPVDLNPAKKRRVSFLAALELLTLDLHALTPSGTSSGCLRAHLDKTTIKLESADEAEHKTQVTLTFNDIAGGGLTGLCFNSRSGMWEPFLEKTSFEMSGEYLRASLVPNSTVGSSSSEANPRADDTSPSKKGLAGLFLSLETSDPSHVVRWNLSPALVDAIARILEGEHVSSPTTRNADDGDDDDHTSSSPIPNARGRIPRAYVINETDLPWEIRFEEDGEVANDFTKTPASHATEKDEQQQQHPLAAVVAAHASSSSSPSPSSTAFRVEPGEGRVPMFPSSHSGNFSLHSPDGRFHPLTNVPLVANTDRVYCLFPRTSTTSSSPRTRARLSQVAVQVRTLASSLPTSAASATATKRRTRTTQALDAAALVVRIEPVARLENFTRMPMEVLLTPLPDEYVEDGGVSALETLPPAPVAMKDDATTTIPPSRAFLPLPLELSLDARMACRPQIARYEWWDDPDCTLAELPRSRADPRARVRMCRAGGGGSTGTPFAFAVARVRRGQNRRSIRLLPAVRLTNWLPSRLAIAVLDAQNNVTEEGVAGAEGGGFTGSFHGKALKFRLVEGGKEWSSPVALSTSPGDGVPRRAVVDLRVGERRAPVTCEQIVEAPNGRRKVRIWAYALMECSDPRAVLRLAATPSSTHHHPFTSSSAFPVAYSLAQGVEVVVGVESDAKQFVYSSESFTPESVLQKKGAMTIKIPFATATTDNTTTSLSPIILGDSLVYRLEARDEDDGIAMRLRPQLAVENSTTRVPAVFILPPVSLSQLPEALSETRLRRLPLLGLGRTRFLHASDGRFRVGVPCGGGNIAVSCVLDANALAGEGDEAVKLVTPQGTSWGVLTISARPGGPLSPAETTIAVHDPDLYLIENQTNEVVHFHQVFTSSGGGGSTNNANPTAAASAPVEERVKPGETRQFGWDAVENRGRRQLRFDFQGYDRWLIVNPDELLASPVMGKSTKPPPAGVRVSVSQAIKTVSVYSTAPGAPLPSTPPSATTKRRRRFAGGAKVEIQMRVAKSCVTLFEGVRAREALVLHFSEAFQYATLTRVELGHGEEEYDFAAQVSFRALQIDDPSFSASLPVVLTSRLSQAALLEANASIPNDPSKGLLNVTLSGRVSGQSLLIFDATAHVGEPLEINVEETRYKKLAKLLNSSYARLSALGSGSGGLANNRKVYVEHLNVGRIDIVLTLRRALHAGSNGSNALRDGVLDWDDDTDDEEGEEGVGGGAPICDTESEGEDDDDDDEFGMGSRETRVVRAVNGSRRKAKLMSESDDDDLGTPIDSMASSTDALPRLLPPAFPSFLTDLQQAQVGTKGVEIRRSFFTPARLAAHIQRKLRTDLLSNVYQVASYALLQTINPFSYSTTSIARVQLPRLRSPTLTEWDSAGALGQDVFVRYYGPARWAAMLRDEDEEEEAMASGHAWCREKVRRRRARMARKAIARASSSSHASRGGEGEEEEDEEENQRAGGNGAGAQVEFRISRTDRLALFIRHGSSPKVVCLDFSSLPKISCCFSVSGLDVLGVKSTFEAIELIHNGPNRALATASGKLACFAREGKVILPMNDYHPFKPVLTQVLTNWLSMDAVKRADGRDGVMLLNKRRRLARDFGVVLDVVRSPRDARAVRERMRAYEEDGGSSSAPPLAKNARVLGSMRSDAPWGAGRFPHIAVTRTLTESHGLRVGDVVLGVCGRRFTDQLEFLVEAFETFPPSAGTMQVVVQRNATVLLLDLKP